MVSIGAAVGLLIVVAVHTFLTAVATRFFRVRLRTGWGSAVYAAVFVPLVLVASTIVLTGGLGLGSGLGDRTVAVLIVLVLPLVLGFTIDLFWMPSPDEVELPDTVTDPTDQEPRRRR
jgi:hypothetical protein